MASDSNKMTADFAGKPKTQSYADAIETFIEGLGPVQREVKAQLSFAVNRKFLWLWAYEQTTDGTLYLNVTLDRELALDGVHKVTQVSKNRWNHHVEVKSSATAEAKWLRELIRSGYGFAAV